MEGDMLTHNLQSFVDEADVLTHKIKSSVPDNEFLSGLCRLVKSNMTGIIGMLDLALEDNFTESVNECLYSVRSCADNLMKMMNHLTDVHSLETGEVQIELQDSSLSEILLDIDQQMYDSMVEMGGVFSVTVHESVPTRIRTDPSHLKQCLLTLIKNTTRELNSDLVMLGVGSNETDDGDWITFEMIHTRSCHCTCERNCICQNYWERVDRVLSWDQGSQSRPESRDLGLAVAHQLAILMGGRVSIESSPQEALRLSLSIPCGTLERSEEVIGQWQHNRALSPVSHSEKETPSYHGRILLADSDRMNQKMMFATLKKLGLDVTIVGSGVEVFKQVQDHQYDLLIVDRVMSDMDGCEVTRQLRSNGLDMPIIALTDNTMKPEIDACLAAGYNEHLPKPIGQAQLTEILSRYLTTSDQPVEPVGV